RVVAAAAALLDGVDEVDQPARRATPLQRAPTRAAVRRNLLGRHGGPARSVRHDSASTVAACVAMAAAMSAWYSSAWSAQNRTTSVHSCAGLASGSSGSGRMQAPSQRQEAPS